MRHLRIGAQRPSERLGRIIGGASGTDQPFWRDALLDPSLECREDIALRIAAGGCRSTASVAETVRAGAATAVRHPGHEKQPVEILGRRSAGRARIRVFRKKGAHRLVVLDRTRRGNGGVSPPVVLNELPARCTERPQVRAGRVEDRSRLRIPDAHVAIEVEHPEIPLGVLEYRRPVVAVAEHELDGTLRGSPA